MALLSTQYEDGILMVTFQPTHLDDQTIVSALGVELQKLLATAKDGRLLLNFSNVEFMSSVMVGQLFLLNRKCKAAGVSIKICRVSPLIMRVFEIVRLQNFIEVLADEQQAREAFGAGSETVSTADEDGRSFEEILAQAQQGDAASKYALGCVFENGTGVPQDSTEALRWYRQAAEGGDANAQHRIGMAFAYGIDVEQDYERAVAWYQKAAEQGHADAQYAMGMSLRYGIAGQEDQQAAAAWYERAAAQGHEKAKDELDQMAEEA